MDSGREERLAARPVYLLPDTMALDTALAELCVRRDARVAELRRQTPATAPGADTSRAAVLDSLRNATRQALEQRARILASRALRTDTTGPDATFAFDSLPVGRYRLWADAEVAGDRWTWLVPVEIEGDSARVSLNNSNIDDNPLRCRW